MKKKNTRIITDAISKCCACDVYPMLSLIHGAYGWQYDKSTNELCVNLLFIREALNHIPPRGKSYEFVDGDSCGPFEIRYTVFKLLSPFPGIPQF